MTGSCGATAAGQRKTLAELGVSEATERDAFGAAVLTAAVLTAADSDPAAARIVRSARPRTWTTSW